MIPPGRPHGAGRILTTGDIFGLICRAKKGPNEKKRRSVNFHVEIHRNKKVVDTCSVLCSAMRMAGAKMP
jgi:hypothetical protein